MFGRRGEGQRKLSNNHLPDEYLGVLNGVAFGVANANLLHLKNMPINALDDHGGIFDANLGSLHGDTDVDMRIGFV